MVGVARICTVGILATVMMACGPGAEGTSATGSEASSGTTSGAPSELSATVAVADSTAAEPTDVDTTGPSATESGESGSTGDPPESCESPIPNITVLACARVGSAMAIADTTVFYTAQGGILSVDAFDGMPPAVVTSEVGDMHAMRIHGPYLYWVAFSDGELRRVHRDRGDVDVMGGLNKPGSVAVDDTFAYVTQYDADASLVRVSLDTQTVEPLYPRLDFAGELNIGVDGGLYWALSTNNGNLPNPIVSGTTSGASMSTLYSDTGMVARMILDEETLFVARYRVGASSIETTSLRSGATETLAVPAYQPTELAVGSSRVYWIEGGISDEMETVWALKSVSRKGGDVDEHAVYDTSVAGLVVAQGNTPIFGSPLGVVRLGP